MHLIQMKLNKLHWIYCTFFVGLDFTLDLFNIFIYAFINFLSSVPLAAINNLFIDFKILFRGISGGNCTFCVMYSRPCWTTELELNLFGAAAIMKQNGDSFWAYLICLEDRRRGFFSCVHRSAQEAWVHYVYSPRKEWRPDGVREAICQSGSLFISLSLSLSPPEC